jgi:hypothetical protein
MIRMSEAKARRLGLTEKPAKRKRKASPKPMHERHAVDPGELIAVSYFVPLRLKVLPNLRVHWRTMDKLKKEQKGAVAVALYQKPKPALPVTITLTRAGKGKLDDDNLASAFKYVRDAIWPLFRGRWLGSIHLGLRAEDRQGIRHRDCD